MFSVSENIRYFTIFHLKQLEELEGIRIEPSERKLLADFNRRHADKVGDRSEKGTRKSKSAGAPAVAELKEELTKKSELLKRQGEEFADVSVWRMLIVLWSSS